MMKLKRYLKPYIGFALAAIVLMFCQAAVDLNLPNLMSDIVNVGIQQGGITEAAPKAVSAEGLQLMSAFMSEGPGSCPKPVCPGRTGKHDGG